MLSDQLAQFLKYHFSNLRKVDVVFSIVPIISEVFVVVKRFL